MLPQGKPPVWHRYPFGFVVYRCVYGNDAEWTQFMDLLTAAAHAGLDEDPQTTQIRDKFSWIIKDNKEELDGATKNEVRRQFNEWTRSANGATSEAMYSNCIYADQEVVTSVLDGGVVGSDGKHGVLPETSFVKILNYKFDEHPSAQTDGEVSNAEMARIEEAREGWPFDDQIYEPIEGCIRRDVGWMKYEARMLIPRAYDLLMDYGWNNTYARPPHIQSV